MIRPEVRLPTAGLLITRIGRWPVITIGIDPHKSSLTAVALEPTGEVAATIRLEITSDDRAHSCARGPGSGASGDGRSKAPRASAAAIAQGLASADEVVVDVPAQLAARARLLNTGHARKTDPIDAASVAAVAQHNRRLHPVRAEDHSIVLRLLSERRDDLAGERTRTANRLHALLRDLIAGGARRNLTASRRPLPAAERSAR